MLKTICYKSKAKQNINLMGFEAIFNETQTKNDRKNITGVLVKRNHVFFQILEGESVVLDALYQKIKEDNRHTNIIELLNKPISHLSFNSFDTGYTIIEHIDALYGLQKYIMNLEKKDTENSTLFLQIIEALLTT